MTGLNCKYSIFFGHSHSRLHSSPSCSNDKRSMRIHIEGNPEISIQKALILLSECTNDCYAEGMVYCSEITWFKSSVKAYCALDTGEDILHQWSEALIVRCTPPHKWQSYQHNGNIAVQHCPLELPSMDSASNQTPGECQWQKQEMSWHFFIIWLPHDSDTNPPGIQCIFFQIYYSCVGNDYCQSEWLPVGENCIIRKGRQR